jgi:ABC-type oligopeptide transport system substrate-binding subunit
MNLKRLKNLIFLSIVICGLIIPTSAFASNSTVQSASNTSISQAISNFFSLFNKSTTSGSVQNTTINSSNYSSMNSSDLFDCFWNWLCNGNNNS